MNEDETLDYLNVDYPSIVVCKDDLIKTLTLVSKISQPNSSSIECNSLAFVPKWESNTVELMITNDLTYFKISIRTSLSHELIRSALLSFKFGDFSDIILSLISSLIS